MALTVKSAVGIWVAATVTVSTWVWLPSLASVRVKAILYSPAFVYVLLKVAWEVVTAADPSPKSKEKFTPAGSKLEFVMVTEAGELALVGATEIFDLKTFKFVFWILALVSPTAVILIVLEGDVEFKRLLFK